CMPDDPPGLSWRRCGGAPARRYRGARTPAQAQAAFCSHHSCRALVRRARLRGGGRGRAAGPETGSLQLPTTFRGAFQAPVASYRLRAPRMNTLPFSLSLRTRLLVASAVVQTVVLALLIANGIHVIERPRDTGGRGRARRRAT